MNRINSEAKLLDVKPMVNYYMDQLQLFELFSKYMPQTPKMHIAPADALSMTVFNIITAPRALYKVSEQAADYLDGIGERPQKASKYNDDRLGRCLDRLYECDRKSLMSELTADAVKAYNLETDIIHNDSTTITFKGRYENLPPDGIRLLYGHNKDFRPDCLQIVYGLNITEDGNVPLSFELFNGNQTDDRTHVPNQERLREMLNKSNFIYVADCKLCNEENLDSIHLNNGYFVTVVPKNRTMLKPFYKQLQNGVVQWQQAFSVPDNRKPTRQNCFYTFEGAPTEKGYRLIWILSDAKARPDQSTRERRLAKAETELAEPAGKLNRYNLKTRNQIESAISKVLKNTKKLINYNLTERKTCYKKKVGSGRPGPDSIYEDRIQITYELSWQRNHAAIEQQALADGTFPLITNTNKQCAEALRIYKQQPGLEKRFSTAKSVLDIAPVFLKKSSRIEAVMFLYFAALMIISLMERAVRKQMADESIENLPILPQKMKTERPTWNNIRYLFRNVHLSLIFIKDRIVKRTLKGFHDIHAEVLRLLGVPLSVYFDFANV